MELNLEDEVEMKFRRVPGKADIECRVSATSNAAMVAGLCRLTLDAAEYMHMTKQELLCRVAVVIFGEDRKEEQEC